MGNVARDINIRGLHTRGRKNHSHVEPEEYDVPLLHNVILPLDPHLAPFLALLLTPALDQVPVPHRFGLDESALEVAVYHPRRPRRLPPPPDGPCPRLRGTRREVRAQVKDVVSFPRQPPQAAIVDPDPE